MFAILILWLFGSVVWAGYALAVEGWEALFNVLTLSILAYAGLHLLAFIGTDDKPGAQGSRKWASFRAFLAILFDVIMTRASNPSWYDGNHSALMALLFTSATLALVFGINSFLIYAWTRPGGPGVEDFSDIKRVNGL